LKLTLKYDIISTKQVGDKPYKNGGDT